MCPRVILNFWPSEDVNSKPNPSFPSTAFHPRRHTCPSSSLYDCNKLRSLIRVCTFSFYNSWASRFPFGLSSSNYKRSISAITALRAYSASTDKFKQFSSNCLHLSSGSCFCAALLALVSLSSRVRSIFFKLNLWISLLSILHSYSLNSKAINFSWSSSSRAFSVSFKLFV